MKFTNYILNILLCKKFDKKNIMLSIKILKNSIIYIKPDRKYPRLQIIYKGSKFYKKKKIKDKIDKHKIKYHLIDDKLIYKIKNKIINV